MSALARLRTARCRSGTVPAKRPNRRRREQAQRISSSHELVADRASPEERRSEELRVKPQVGDPPELPRPHARVFAQRQVQWAELVSAQTTFLSRRPRSW